MLDLPDALTGPVISAPSDAPVCPLRTCDNIDILSSCGEKARCVRSHCVCDRGFKGHSSFGPVVRGVDDLQALTIWVDPGLACDVPCDDLSCAEVEQVLECFDSTPVTTEEKPAESTSVTTEGNPAEPTPVTTEEKPAEPTPWEEEEWGDNPPAPTTTSTVIEGGGLIPWEEEQWGQEEPETATITGGAIRVPDVVIDESGDFVEGVAAPGTFGEDT